jgi:cation diffusion facilitator CzcD-associated flavoprotein CzcO
MTGDIKPHYEAVVVGAGVSGIYQIKRLADLGIDALVIDAAPDLGGTWYWNRYPGALRFRKLHLWLFVFEGAARGVALEGAVFGAAGEPALPQLRHRQVRSSQIHAL